MAGLKNPLLEPIALTGFAGVFLAGFLFARELTCKKPERAVPAATQTEVVADLPGPVTVSPGDTLHKADTGLIATVNTYTGMEPFFGSLQSSGTPSTSIHIAYFGDSMIEGDLVTHPLRKKLQQRFGGNGIGFAPITTPQPGFRTTIFQQFNDEWKVYSFAKSSHPRDFFPGLSGYVFESKEGAQVTFKSSPAYRPFKQASILYGGLHPVVVSIKTDTTTKVVNLPAGDAVSSYSLTPDSAFSSITLKVLSPEPGIIFGLNFENEPGVYLDNYAFRGNSGLPLRQIPAEVFSGFNEKLHNKLIIVHYGLNVFTPGVADYHWYEMAMRSVIHHIKTTSPGIPVLMISMPDRAALISGEYATPAELPEFINLQKRVADAEQVAFFNLFNAMGGVNSMRNWVEGKTRLACEDYTHPNGAGATRIAEMIFGYLMSGYDQFVIRKDSATISSLIKPIR